MDSQQLAHLSRLSALRIAPEQEAVFLEKMDQVLDFIAQVQACPIDEKELEQMPFTHTLQPATVGEAYADPVQLLGTTAHPLVDQQLVLRTTDTEAAT